jgi:hypothetical protein
MIGLVVRQPILSQWIGRMALSCNNLSLSATPLQIKHPLHLTPLTATPWSCTGALACLPADRGIWSF